MIVVDAEPSQKSETALLSNGPLGQAPAFSGVSYETVVWERDPAIPVSRRQQRLQSGDYRAAIPAQISTAAFDIDAELRVEAAEAAATLHRFDSELGRFTAPFSAILLRTEAASSSQIEQLTASAKQVSLAQAGAKHASPNARAIAANTNAMRRALDQPDTIPFDEQILRIHQTLMKTDPAMAWCAGKWRTQQVWIGGGASPHTSTFVPPTHDRIAACMHDLAVFTQRVDIAPLEQIAIAHAQFETIHPFPDGNGRTGRALAHTTLKQYGVVQHTTAPISAGILQQQQHYFEALTAYRAGDVQPIIEVFVAAAFAAAHLGSRLANDTKAVQDRWHAAIPSRAGSAARRGIDFITETPAFTITALANHLGVTYRAAADAVATYERHSVCQQASSNKRNRYWLATELIETLDAFAEELRRPKP